MAKIDIINEMLERHTDAEIIEHLYRQMQTVNKYYDGVIAEGLDPQMLLTQVEIIDSVTDILKALHKRNQERQAQAGMI